MKKKALQSVKRIGSKPDKVRAVFDVDNYDKKNLRQELRAIGYGLRYRTTIKSTMDFAFKNKLEKSVIVLTEHQTNGRGRHGNSWDDEKNKSVLMAIIEKKALLDKVPFNFLPRLVALQVCLALRKATGCEEIKIKWPNDIMKNGKKIGGILIEKREDEILIGIGIDIYKSGLAGDSCLLKKNSKLGRQKIVLGIAENWFEFKSEIASGLFAEKISEYEKSWKNNSYLLRKKVFMSLKSLSVMGTVCDSRLNGDIVMESAGKKILISENDYIPGSCVVG